MTPTLPDILMGQAIALSVPQPPEAGGDYMVGRLGLIAALALLAAQEAERGTAARARENAAIRALLARQGADDIPPTDDGLSWSALDAVNAALRGRLIALHQAVEESGDTGVQRDILTLYQAMASGRRLELPAGLGG